ncbi:hypothetical protein NXC24_PB00132 (plasmid) [Rhizobium sp. NXC24]|nr:hypothetical protein NXC24_PB00132 [Rhizobium sp. NXC24]
MKWLNGALSFREALNDPEKNTGRSCVRYCELSLSIGATPVSSTAMAFLPSKIEVNVCRPFT